MSRDQAQSTIHQMNLKIAHRGPDDQGVFLNEDIALGHQRLSILDTSKLGHQPMSSKDEKHWVVFNGEIYNFKSLRSELTQLGHHFKTNCDTEVVLTSYLQWGLKCFSKFSGMFSIAIYDQLKNKLVLARDRVGIKPLYYYSKNGCLVFSSELKAILEHPEVNKEIDTNGVISFLKYRYVQSNECIWKGVKKAIPGSILEMNLLDHSTREEKYWNLPFPSDQRNILGPSEGYEIFEGMFDEVVSNHMVADVPVGVLLSGGLDSSTVLASVVKQGFRPSCFTVAFKDSPQCNELPYARQVAKHYGSTLHEIEIGPDEFFDFLPKLTYFSDEPLADLASVPLYYVSKLASKHVKVVLSGEGADEILGGYHFNHSLLKFDLLKLLWSFNRKLYNKVILKNLGSTAVDIPPQNLPSHLNLSMSQVFDTQDIHQLGLGEIEEIEKLIYQRAYEKVNELHPVNQMLYTYSHDWLVENLLMKADKMTMANSIELRVPFLDPLMVETCLGSSMSYKWGKEWWRGYTTKNILRTYSKKHLPAQIYKRKKQGFPVPVYDWLSDEKYKEMVTGLISHNSKIMSYLDNKVCFTYLEKGISQNANNIEKHQLWSLLIFEYWLQQWN